MVIEPAEAVPEGTRLTTRNLLPGHKESFPRKAQAADALHRVQQQAAPPAATKTASTRTAPLVHKHTTYDNSCTSSSMTTAVCYSTPRAAPPHAAPTGPWAESATGQARHQCVVSML
jgi:hypothetical protein